MHVPLLEFNLDPIKKEILTAITEVIDSQQFIMGKKVAELEDAISKYVGSPYAISCASGSDALLLSLMALGIGSGDEVITTSYSFFATVGAIARLGAKPVMVDIDAETFNINPEEIEAAITSKTRAIMPVHLFGQSADMTKIMDIASRHDLHVIEDAAQAIGGRWEGQNLGTIGAFGCFSFFPSKNLGAFGDGGIITTSDAHLANKLKALRVHGGMKKYYHDYIGINSRLDTIQAAILLVKLPYLDHIHSKRQHHACRYYALFSEYQLTDLITLPVQNLKATHVYNQFVIKTNERNELQEFLKKNDVSTAVYYPLGLHEQPCFDYLDYTKGSFPNTEKAARTSLAIPVYAEMTDEQQRYVVSTIASFYGKKPL